ncbi:Endogenous retrovirus group V member 1 Env polyprotein [Anabarilius grahami]|uniref:Endogenous retrovirus group V member 1 Env polyprotein n=1 Tax=Anabarilius grahami TaxID=495550 RepID=A0A3N0YBU7_ANAGA|nr:Endogenous retrovirus group V member 1 Env polyprotein [Anabarilius grahami]
MKSLKLVALQNRAALDYLLAKDGGVCAVIGDQCCTYIPDIDHNMTDVIEHMTQLRDEIENNSEPSTDTDFFSWVGNTIGKSFWNLLKDLGASFALIIGTLLLLYFFVRITICICTAGFKELCFYSPANTKNNDKVNHDIA